MYYALNLISITFLMFSISLVYTKEMSSGFALAFLTIAAVANLLASIYATLKYRALVGRIEKLEDRKEDKRCRDTLTQITCMKN